MNATTATPAATTPANAASRPKTPPQMPGLPPRQRLGAAVASVLVSSLLLTAVVVGLTSSPEGAIQLADRATATARG